MSYVYEGNSRSAVGYLDSLSADCGEEPFYLLIKSRVARELLTIDDEDTEEKSDDQTDGFSLPFTISTGAVDRDGDTFHGAGDPRRGGVCIVVD